MNLHEVIKAGKSGFVYTALGISFALVVGLSLGKFLQVRGNASYLITTGTAICGGSAIAAIAPIIQADEQETAVSLATIFILEFRRTDCVSADWRGAASVADPIRIVGRARDSRHKFGCRRCIEIRRASVDCRNDGEISACALDRSACTGNCCGEAQQIQSPVAVVHPAVLPRSSNQYLRRVCIIFLDDIFHARTLRIDCNIIFDRLEYLARIAEESRMAPARARHRALDHCRHHEPLLHPHRMDFVVTTKSKSRSLAPLGMTVLEAGRRKCYYCGDFRWALNQATVRAMRSRSSAGLEK